MPRPRVPDHMKKKPREIGLRDDEYQTIIDAIEANNLAGMEPDSFSSYMARVGLKAARSDLAEHADLAAQEEPPSAA